MMMRKVTPQAVSRILASAGCKRSTPYPGRIHRNWTEGFEVEHVSDTIVRVDWRNDSLYDMANDKWLHSRDEHLAQYEQVLYKAGYQVELIGDDTTKALKVW